MIGYELSIREIMPFDVFISIYEKNQKSQKKNRTKGNQKKEKKGKKAINKRQIQLLAFSCGKYFVVRDYEC